MVDTTISVKCKRKYTTLLSNISQHKAESILGFDFDAFYYQQVPIQQFIKQTAPDELKEGIFKRLIDCIRSEGFPEATISPMNEAVVADFVAIILQTTISYYKRKSNHLDLKLSRKNEIVSKDKQVRGRIEFLVIQKIIFNQIRYKFVVETKCDSLGKGLPQLLFAVKSAYDANADKQVVYGFLTTGIRWQAIRYDGHSWSLSEPTIILIENMENQQNRWLQNNTQILDVIYNFLLSI